MKFSFQQTTYQSTYSFSKIILDYLSRNENLSEFYNHPPDITGIKHQISNRQFSDETRKVLVNALKKQYEAAGIELKTRVKTNIEKLLQPNCFTVTTAHQPNIFTGPLYVIYKIAHAIQLAAFLNKSFSENEFVPVYYLGSEDADLEEIGQVTINGVKHVWQTNQTGATGRMKVDHSLLQLLPTIKASLSSFPFCDELINLFYNAYTPGKSIAEASTVLIHQIFEQYGLVILNPDDKDLKRIFNPFVKEEIKKQFSEKQINETTSKLKKHYNIQVKGRDINLFYLRDSLRVRILKAENGFIADQTNFEWTEDELLHEVESFPERFSGNVILRGLFQETILPNIAFIGGGGELAYWLEFKSLFDYCKIPLPILVLRNSFLLMSENQSSIIRAMSFEPSDLFNPADELMKQYVNNHSENNLSLQSEREALCELYKQIGIKASSIDKTLVPHTGALAQAADKKLRQLEKKMLRAEKRKFIVAENRIEKIKKELFPNGVLQERIENFALFYALKGPAFIHAIINASMPLDQLFTIITFED